MNFQAITLDIEQLAARQTVSREWWKHLEMTQSDGGDDWFRNEIAIQMVRQIATIGGESVTVPEIRVPDGLWQTIKERLGLSVRYRVLQREQTWKAVEMLPNVDLPTDYRVGAVKVLVSQ